MQRAVIPQDSQNYTLASIRRKLFRPRRTQAQDKVKAHGSRRGLLGGCKEKTETPKETASTGSGRTTSRSALEDSQAGKRKLSSKGTRAGRPQNRKKASAEGKQGEANTAENPYLRAATHG
eukprot:957681-Pelagomonas_calceolata.AAC.2